MEDKNVKYEILEVGASAGYTGAATADKKPNKSPLDIDWPKLSVGELIRIKNAPFRVARLNASTVVLRPESGKYSARNVMRKIGRRD